MESSRQNKSLAVSKLGRSQSVRKATKFIAPLLLLSFVLLQRSSYLLDFSTMVIDKNYMFILCNGILVLIAKTSGLIGNWENVPEKAAESRPEMEDKETAEAKKDVVLITEELSKEIAKEEEGEAIAEGEKEEEVKKDVVLVTEEELKVVAVKQQDEEVEEEGNGLLSAEELQRKCEEFIRKMKAGIKSEAQQQQQQQLIMVQ
ncbi:hypothetical protein LINGRAHAP2_LOCUS35750 [Linum grandiflorum]